METKNIDVNGEAFPCPIEWTVDQAEARIKSFYSFPRGGIRQNNVPVLGNLLIGSLTGNLVYVGGQSIQQSGKFSHHYFPITLLSYPPLSVTLPHFDDIFSLFDFYSFLRIASFCNHRFSVVQGSWGNQRQQEQM